MNIEFKKDSYILTTDKKKLNTSAIHRVLSVNEWTKGISFDTVKKSIKKSLCFGLYKDGNNVGFARVVSDYATILYISDIFILEAHKSDELLGWMVESILKHPDLRYVKNWLLRNDNDLDAFSKNGFVKYEGANKILVKRNL